jgi:hypothetical protein
VSLVATWLEAGGSAYLSGRSSSQALSVGWFIVFGLFGNLLMPSPRRFRGHGLLKNSAALAFVIKDSRGQKIAYVYYEDELAHENDDSP